MIKNEGYNIFLKEYAKISNFSIEKAEELTKNFIEAIRNTLSNYEIQNILLKRLGSFIVHEQKRKKWNFVGKKEVVTFPAKKAIKFKFSRNAKEKLKKY